MFKSGPRISKSNHVPRIGRVLAWRTEEDAEGREEEWESGRKCAVRICKTALWHRHRKHINVNNS